MGEYRTRSKEKATKCSKTCHCVLNKIKYILGGKKKTYANPTHYKKILCQLKCFTTLASQDEFSLHTDYHLFYFRFFALNVYFNQCKVCNDRKPAPLTVSGVHPASPPSYRTAAFTACYLHLACLQTHQSVQIIKSMMAIALRSWQRKFINSEQSDH